MKDSLAMTCSGLCIGHCLLTPVLLAAGGFGFVGAFLGSELLHKVLLIPVLCLALSSLPFSFRRHLNWYPLVLGALGCALLIAGINAAEELELGLTLTGGALVIAAHFINRRYLAKLEATA